MLRKIKSVYIMKDRFHVLLKRKFFNLIKYNKQYQEKLGLSLQDYELFGEIEIEIIPILSLSNRLNNSKFINLDNYNNENYITRFSLDTDWEKALQQVRKNK